mgnify:FL=1
MELFEDISKLEEFKTLLEKTKRQKTCFVFGLYTQKLYIASLLAKTANKKLILIVPDEAEARKYKSFLDDYLKETYIYPPKDYNFRNIETVSHYNDNARIETLAKMKNREFNCVIIPAAALGILTVPPSEYKEIIIKSGEEISFDEIASKLSEMGYSHSETVEEPGQYCVRGGIIDVFSHGNELPYRIEFFGNEVDTIATFAIDTQRRAERLDSAKITQAKENSSNAAAKILNEIKDKKDKYSKEDSELLKNGILPCHDRYIPALFDAQNTIINYISQDDIVCFLDFKKCENALSSFEFRISEEIASLAESGIPFIGKNYFLKKELIFSEIKHPLIFETLPCSIEAFREDEIISFVIDPIDKTSPNKTVENIKEFLDDGYKVTVTAPDKESTEKIKATLNYNPNLFCMKANIPFGYIIKKLKTALFVYVNKEERDRRRKRHKYGEKINNIFDIQKGDYIVHEDFGIGLYDGVYKIENHGIVDDRIKIVYAGGDTLYIPCDQLDRISKYVGGGEGIKVRLNKMGGGEWKKTKSKVKAAVKDMANQLIELYGQRLRIRGHQFSEDTEWQKEFEEEFEFEETEDQLKCIQEIKADMQSPTPMDRLLCGDVGFGKTEVALRAVFKCVCDGKQAAILAPTTLLAFQHYNTAKRRFKNFPVNIEMLSRFKNASQQAEILKRMKNGGVDIIIGTHKLLQKNVNFKDLGLIIIDEEQRFGVAHKEHLKELAKNADVLTLSATPIPRTLNMSLSGIRDISVINEPPHDRLPVTTYVAEFDIGLVVDAIKKEVARGGQCFYLHNRVDTISKAAGIIKEMTGLRVGIAHGRMSKEEISDIWEDLLDHEIDVLVCTTIIEAGVDVPNCNTLIIEDADRLGLAQLHQIRGRVGRSSKRAYAYFLYRKGKILTEDAYKRLMTIREFTEFGAGLKIAMRDLEIRGAGNILGAEQSGHLAAVGYDMYMKLLGEAVREKRGIIKKETDCTVKLKINAYIPETYIRDINTRIEIYKEISSIDTDEDYSDIVDELIDRFGDPPPEIIALLDIAKCRSIGRKVGITSVVEKDLNLLIYTEEEPPLALISAISGYYTKRGELFFSPGDQCYFTLKTENPVPSLLNFMKLYRSEMEKRQKDADAETTEK